MDVLVPKVGELIGGSQREERLEVINLPNQIATVLYCKTLWACTSREKYFRHSHSARRAFSYAVAPESFLRLVHVQGAVQQFNWTWI